MHNVKHVKRTYPDDSFTISCGLSLHNCSSIRCGNIRKSMHFLSLPNKRSLFAGLRRSNVSLDAVLGTCLFSSHIYMLSNLSQSLKEKLASCENRKLFHSMLIMTLHLHEMRILERHCFSIESHYFESEDNDSNELATAKSHDNFH